MKNVYEAPDLFVTRFVATENLMVSNTDITKPDGSVDDGSVVLPPIGIFD